MYEVMWIQDHMEWRYVRKGHRGTIIWNPIPVENDFPKTGRMAPKTFRKYNERG